jgi:uncharacterized membrane protein YccC
MVYHWLRIYVRVMPFVVVVCFAGAIYLAVTGESSDAWSWARGAIGCLVCVGFAWLAVRAIENRRAAEFTEASD